MSGITEYTALFFYLPGDTVGMTKGVLGIIGCPMLDDNLVYSISKDPEEKRITIVDNEYDATIRRKLDAKGIPYELINWDDVVVGRFVPSGGFDILILMINLGLHSKPELLKSTVEEYTKWMHPRVDAIGFYLGTCGNYNWNIPKWCAENGYGRGAMFCDKEGNLCDDCVGVAISGGPRYLQMQKTYPGHFYLFPAMATNFDDFMNADQADTAATEESLTDEVREVLGIEPGRDGYLRWLLQLGGYEYILKIDTGLGSKEQFDADVLKVAERTHLKIKNAEAGWGDLGPTDALYDRCKSMLSQ